jgi:hypothetical protein
MNNKCEVCNSELNVEKRNISWQWIVTNDNINYICKECLDLWKIFQEINNELDRNPIKETYEKIKYIFKKP